MKIQALTETGSADFRTWLESRRAGDVPPRNLLDGTACTAAPINIEVDLEKTFSTRYEFGSYVTEMLTSTDVSNLLSRKHDGVWDWLTVAYFAQFGRKTSKPWHYVVTRRGHSGSLAYRHLARTSVEMYWRHRKNSLVMLSTDLSTWGEMSEQLTSRQNVAYHRACISTANSLYLVKGKLRRGAAARVPPVSRRRTGDRRGRGGVGRLALAVRRLSRTYDTHVLDASQMITLLPKEFSSFGQNSTV